MSYRIIKPRIGIDYFGTLNKNTDLMRKFLAKLTASEIEIFIISGASEIQLKSTLLAQSFFKEKHYTEAITIESYLRQRNIHLTYKMDGSYNTQPYLFFGSKSIICKEKQITTMVDSDYRFKKFFDCKNCGTRFVLSTHVFGIFAKNYVEEKIGEEEAEICSCNDSSVFP
jgi:hypothetical protein